MAIMNLTNWSIRPSLVFADIEELLGINANYHVLHSTHCRAISHKTRLNSAMTNDEIRLPKARPRPEGIGFLPETKSVAVGGPVGCANALVTASLNFKPSTSRYEASWGTVAGCGAMLGNEAWRMKLLSDSFVRGREARSMPWLDSGREGGEGGVGDGVLDERKKVGFLRTFIIRFGN